MAKKSFKADNPALQFITGPDASEPEPAPRPKRKPQKTADGAMQIMGSPTAKPGIQGRKAKPQAPTEERKTKRLNLLLQPSIMDDLKKIAAMKQTSVNDLINSVLKDYNASESNTIKKYDSVFGK